MTIEFIDIGANLTHESFDQDREQVLENAIAAGLYKIIITATSVDETNRAIECTDINPSLLWATAGVHPHNAKNTSDNFIEELEKLSMHNKVIAIGECGLDYCRNFSTTEKQRAVFEKQIKLSLKTGLPLFLHQRDAHEDFITMLKEQSVDEIKGVTHCFTGDKGQLRDHLDLGLYIGITGWVCDPRRNQDLLESIKYLPMDRLLIETDAPYLMPKELEKKLKTRRNEPKYIREIAEFISNQKGIEVEDLANIAKNNTENLFGRLLD
ncbi:MAG: TatD family hydrolase [Gammaproteobacteria bacterium]|nr:TatD family hydrolase [Gammaproteobacteria bacterium]